MEFAPILGGRAGFVYSSIRLFELLFRVAVFEGIVIVGKFKNISARAYRMIGLARGVAFGTAFNGFVEVFGQYDNDEDDGKYGGVEHGG